MSETQKQNPPNPRACAVRALEWVFAKHRPLDLFLEQDQRFLALPVRDRALCRAIIGTSLRRFGQIELLLADLLAKPLPKAAITARQILRAGAAELLYLRSAPHGVVNSFVQLAGQIRKARPYKGLINAILRRIAREDIAQLAAKPQISNIPTWPGENWERYYGSGTRERAAISVSEPPALDLTILDDPDVWAKQLGGTRLGQQTVRLQQKGRVEDIAGYAQGKWIVQDASAALPVQLLSPKPGELIADLCAAPGGKTMQMAHAGAVVSAFDHKKSRLVRLEENLARTSLSATLICGDAAKWRPTSKFDAVLLDAPCSATGIFRHHPDVLYNRRASDVPVLAEAQLALALNAAKFLKKSARMIYCVCSAEPEEGEQVIEKLLEQGSLRLAPFTSEEAGFAAPFLSQGMIRIVPGALGEQGGMDAFFIARLIKP
ncbi:16S rRNA (cytosine(967)-C(5))-methyltransferase [hydrothermal vent metagenome]|uniref:16S rRNA (Cytosine(967)-C(5))-methyltransferase n=1 Tax=hydrothermal vent metagenome TaxID=652676 RepID=A0A3B0RTF0_9ZZZZ